MGSAQNKMMITRLVCGYDFTQRFKFIFLMCHISLQFLVLKFRIYFSFSSSSVAKCQKTKSSTKLCNSTGQFLILLDRITHRICNTLHRALSNTSRDVFMFTFPLMTVKMTKELWNSNKFRTTQYVQV